jgi:phenylpyruvate tautomerase
MPLIKVQTSATPPSQPETEKMLKSLSALLAKHLGKPESYVMTAFESDAAMTFGGTSDPACYVEIKSVGSMSPQLTKAMSQDFCQKLGESLSVSPNRIYIEFADSKGSMWGWNGSTF